MSNTTAESSAPLIVDMDGTLLATDVLWEAVLLLLKQSPWRTFLIPIWLLRGKVYFKNRIIEYVTLDAELLPVHKPVLDFVRQEFEGGRTTILATASHLEYAEQVAARHPFFHQVIATTNGENLGGEEKAKAIEQLLGSNNYDYIGDRSADIPIWQRSRHALAVNPAPNLEKRTGKKFYRVFQTKQSGLRAYLRAMRPHQWLKNLLLFLPLVLAHRITDIGSIVSCLLAFVSFSLCASSVYIINDLLDLESDRKHDRKKHRPFASGALPVYHGLLMAFVLSVVAFTLATFLQWKFVGSLTAYVLLTTAYSVYLKRIAIVDVLILALLYAFRVLSGAIAVQVPVSTWMLAFSMFMFLSLAFVKRYAELRALSQQNRIRSHGRGYHAGDAELLRTVGPASGYLSVLVFALYINSADVVRLYAQPSLLWLIQPLLLYWITRVWLIAERGEMHDDPVVYAMKDKSSYLVALLTFVIVVAATVSFSF